MIRQEIPTAAAEALDPALLAMLAGALDVAGDALRVLADRADAPDGRSRYLARATACYGAAHLLRKIAE